MSYMDNNASNFSSLSHGGLTDAMLQDEVKADPRLLEWVKDRIVLPGYSP